MEECLTISAIAGKSSVNQQVNLDVIARCIPVAQGESGVIGVKYGNSVRRGQLKKIKKKKLFKNTRRNTGFINQCTMIVRLSNSKMVNVKLFNTGEMVLTGATSIEDNNDAISVLGTALKNIPGMGEYPHKCATSVKETFNKDLGLKTYLKKFAPVLNRLNNECFDANVTLHNSIDDMSSDPASEKKFMMMTNIISLAGTLLDESMLLDWGNGDNKHGNLISHCCGEIQRGESRWCWIETLKSRFQLVQMLERDWFKLGVDLQLAHDDPESVDESTGESVVWLLSKANDLLDYFGCQYMINRGINSPKSEVRAVLRTMSRQTPIKLKTHREIVVSMPPFWDSLHTIPIIPTCWNCGTRVDYVVNRTRLNELLNKHHMDVLRSSVFRPDQHPAVNVKYVSAAVCNGPHRLKPSKTGISIGCHCCDVTVLIFRTGDLIITGAKNYDQIIETVNIMENIMKSHRHEIEIEIKTGRSTGDKIPSMISKEGDIYISKDHILSNPRNYLLLGKINLRDHYQNVR